MVSSDNPQNIPISIEDEMKSSFMDYAMSVIVARALPDARDGLKPVHRRILYAQQQANNVWNRPYVKCARIVGDVLGKFHPHGDAATYDALVRMAQDFSMRYQLIDGQGNFGSVNGDPPAAYRYTECRMERLASEMLADIDKETVNWVPNYDEKELEPTVLPSRAPNLLLNGATGIAVGMATNIPPHNLNEIIDATVAMIKNPQITTRELLALVPGPDFPTGGIIHGRRGIHLAYETGRGQIMVRGKSEFEEMKGGRTAIIVTEIPYQLNKKRWIEETADLVREKRLEGISDIRDESDRTGMRVVFELRKDAVPAIVLNNLFKMTALQSSFSVNMLAIVDGRPKVLTLAEALARFIEHRRNVVTRRCMFELREARLRREIVEGLGLAVMQIDRIIAIIRSSAEPEEAKTRLMAEPMKGLEGFLERAGRPANEVETARAAGFYNLTDRQAQAILEMRLARLTGLEREKLEAEYRELWATTDRLDALLADEGKLMGVIQEELAALKLQYGDARRTQIIDVDAEILDEELIAHEEMIVTVTHNGYIKRTPVSEYRAQARGGRGVKGAESASDDFVAELFVAETHDHILMFTDKGRVYAKRVFETPLGKRDSKGKALVNFLELQEGEKVLTMLPVKKFDPGWFVFMATKSGTVKKTELDSFGNIRATGIRAMGLDEGDNLIAVKLTNGEMDVLLASKNGYAVHFQEDKVRPMGRDARGVRGMDLREGDSLIGMATFPRDAQETLTILTVCEKGFGKRTPLAEYPTKNRGGMGVITIRTTERNGKVVAVRVVSNEDHLILITDRGKLIRVPVAGVSTVGRATQGVRIMRVDEGEKVSSVERLAEPEDQAGIEVATPVEAEAATEEELLEEGEAGDEESTLPDDDEGTETLMSGPRSHDLFTRAQAAIPGGVNSPVRAFRAVGGDPIFFTRGAGARVWDVDDNEYLDYVGSWGPLIVGHAHPAVLAAIQEAAAHGTSFGAPTELEVRFAEHLRMVLPSLELVRCVSSGTEATMSAIRVARGFTGRDKIVKIDGGYHGHADCLLAEAGSGAATMGIPGSAGVPAGAAKDTLVVPWNDLDLMGKRLVAGDIAAVIVEPVCGNMGVVPPQPGYLEGLRALCTAHGTVLIFDEVMTGFRVAHGGAQARFGVRPDLTCLGKIVGGGLPAACFGGRKDIMSKLSPLGPVYQAGTLSGNPLALAAGLATLELVAKPGTYERLETLAARLEAGLGAAAHAAGVPSTINRVGSMMTSFFSPDPVFDYASAKKCDTKRYGRFFSGMLAEGVYLAPSQFEAAFVSLAHTDADIDRTIDAAKSVLKALA